VFDHVREACAAVAARARAVTIDEAVLDAYVDGILGETEPPMLDPEHHFLGCPAQTAGFVVTLDAINFGSGWWPHIEKLPGLSGYCTMATHLTRRYAQDGPLSPAALAGLELEETAALFGQGMSGPQGELMGHFTRALNELGRLVVERFDGDFAKLVHAADNSAARRTRRSVVQAGPADIRRSRDRRR